MAEVLVPYCCDGDSPGVRKVHDNGDDNEGDGVLVDLPEEKDEDRRNVTPTPARAKLVTVYIDEAHATDEW